MASISTCTLRGEAIFNSQKGDNFFYYFKHPAKVGRELEQSLLW